MSGLSSGKASAVLILVISISLLQATVFLTQARRTGVISIEGGSIGPPERSSVGVKSASTVSQTTVSNDTVTIPTTTTVPTTVPTTVLVSITNTTTVMSAPLEDYTPLGIAVVVAVAMIALVIMFMRRRR